MRLEDRAKVHAALGDPQRLRLIDDLLLTDRTVAELASLVAMPGNLLAHHLEVLENAGLIERRVSEGDRRYRYVSLKRDHMNALGQPAAPSTGSVVFVCSHNSARSQFAAAVWRLRTGQRAQSAGTEPARQVHPLAVRVAFELGVDLSRAKPAGYQSIRQTPDLVVSVCDRAREAGVPGGKRHLHWSVPDPVRKRTVRAFRDAFGEIAQRVDLLAEAAPAPDMREVTRWQ